MGKIVTLRNEVFDYAKKNYNTTPEYLWKRFPEYAVLRHNDNRKWYALIMNISKMKLGNFPDITVDIINLKLSDPLALELLTQQEGYFRGYHISRGNWVSVLLDGSVGIDEIYSLIDESFAVTAKKKKKSC